MIQGVTKNRVVGVDIGAQTTNYAIVDVRGNIIAQGEFPTQDHPDISEFTSYLSERLMMLMEENGGYDSIHSVGISVSSGNFCTGHIENSPNLPWKGRVPLAAFMRDRLGLAVAVGNNAHARSLGEHTYGIAHGINDFVVITMGTGLGSCLFSNNHPHLGNNGFAGEIGHVCVKPNGRQCGCGSKGCLETYCSERGVLCTARMFMDKSDAPSLMRGCENLTPQQIIDFCEQGDQMAIKVFQVTGEVLGVALANYASVINPEAFIFTGSLSRAGKWLIDPARKAFEANVFYYTNSPVSFLVSSLSDDERNLLGASALAWEVQEYSLFK